jgi:hypothetical protein
VGKLDFEIPGGKLSRRRRRSLPFVQLHEKKTAQPAAFSAKRLRACYLDGQSLSSLSSSADNACPSLD